MKVLLIVIDAASPRVFCPAVQTGRLKQLNRLADAGQMHQASVSIFPSITPAATASIITGVYPAQHGIVGASWYDEGRDQVAYYGDDFWVIANEGFGAFLRNFLLHLNGDYLTAPTLFERVEQTGRRAASLNYLVYRGLCEHRVNVPWLLAILPGTPLTERVKGPSLLCLGDFVSDGRGHPHGRGKHGALHRFGMDDAATGALLCEAAEKGTLPDFTVAYFADNDYRSHEVGPFQALPVLDRIDEMLGTMFDAAGGLEHFLSHTAIVVTSDHGHCDVLDDPSEAVIDLDTIFGDFRQARLGESWEDGDELMICPNMRAAQVYVREKARLPDVIRAARSDARIDLVIHRDTDADSTRRYHALGPAGELTFWRGGAKGREARDAHGSTWRWDGEAAVLRLVSDGASIESRDYPNAFERIAGALDADLAGDLWLTASPGREFQVRGGTPHVGGASHGALHALDSLSPLIYVAPGNRLPNALRSIDVAALCLRALGIDT